MPLRRRSTSGKRVRRSAEEAQRQILDAAEQMLARVGPDSIRLQEVARAVGVSHPTVLHHFGSREALVEAVVERSMAALEAELLTTLRMRDIGEPEVVELIERVSRTIGKPENARLFAWLLLSGHAEANGNRQLRSIAQAAHALRQKQRGADLPQPEFQDTLFSMLLLALALFGEALAGESLRASAGLGKNAASARRFREWLSKLIVQHMEQS
jgi:AcrR family transcriptional regulator